MWSDDHPSGPRHFVAGAGSTMGGGDAVIADAVEWNGTLFLSGRADVDPATLAVRHADFEGQARAVLADVLGVLEANDAKPLRAECYLADAADFAAWNRIWSETFAPPRPARTTVVAGFAVAGLLVEVQVTAAVRR